ncbi:MAG: amidase [Myxococcales bacterium]|nr:amidase [Myxococcota bacterium]MDW8280906.1 amidase [Myxococcales bacterium]
MIRTRQVSSREVVEAHIRRIEAVNGRLNAVVRDRFAEARREADEADARVRSAPAESLPPLLGVPCTIKESFALRGMPQTAGLVARRGVVADKDAPTVERLRRAGAIPVGVTNLSELCMWMESNNRVYGRTRNPYDPRRIVGGSSGGEGAIIGAGGVPFGLGADIGGSIRLPAFFCGVFGHKPSGGLVPNTGQFPIASGPALRYLTTGPLCRRAEDLWPLLRLLAGPDGQDSACQDIALGEPSSVHIHELDVISIESNGIRPPSAELLAAQRRCAEALAAAGARVRLVTLPLLRLSRDIWSAMLEASGGPTFRELLFQGRHVSLPRELVRWALRRSPHTLPALALTLLERAPELMPQRRRAALEAGQLLRRQLTALLGPQSVLLYPSYPTVAPRHLRPLWPPFNWVYTAIVNVMELPATQVPLGLGPSSLPLGVQVVAAWGNDHLCIAVAQFLERTFGGWVPPQL